MTHGSETRRPKTYPARAVRQGDIVLRSGRRRAVFVAGLAGIVLLPLLLLLIYAVTSA